MVFVGNLRLYIRIFSIELILRGMVMVIRMTVLVPFRYYKQDNGSLMKKPSVLSIEVN